MVTDRKFKISLVVPFYNEESNIDVVYKELKTVLSPYPDVELIFVDDGSTDGSLQIVKALSESDASVKFLSLSRNFGHQNALKAGLDSSSGDCVISIDADLQQPPARITGMIDKWLEGYDVVYSIRNKDRNLPVMKRFTSNLFYWFINLISDVKINKGTADFRLLDKKVVNELRKLSENYLFIRGLIPWLGFKQAFIHFDQDPRLSGKSKYTYRKMFRFASSGITSFSVRPLKISILIGTIIAIIAFIYALYAIYCALFTDKVIEGWTSILVSVLFLGGIQLIMIGILGEYLGKMFIENKRRPNYVIDEKNF